MQYTDGITGALIVHPTEPAPAGFPAWDEDLLVEMSDVYHTFSASMMGEEYVDVSRLNLTAGEVAYNGGRAMVPSRLLCWRLQIVG